MPKIEEFRFGTIVVGGKTYTHDILILSDGTVKHREDVFLNFVNHIVKRGEITELLKAYPEVIIIGTGTDAKVKLSFDIERLVTELKADLIALPSPQAVERYNQLVDKGKQVAALIHITD
jgi:hypothetical protein